MIWKLYPNPTTKQSMIIKIFLVDLLMRQHAAIILLPMQEKSFIDNNQTICEHQEDLNLSRNL